MRLIDADLTRKTIKRWAMEQLHEGEQTVDIVDATADICRIIDTIDDSFPEPAPEFLNYMAKNRKDD